jgi:LysM repeat protein
MALASQNSRARDYRPRRHGLSGRQVVRLSALALSLVAVVGIGYLVLHRGGPKAGADAAAQGTGADNGVAAADATRPEQDTSAAAAVEPGERHTSTAVYQHAAPEPAVVSGDVAKSATGSTRAAAGATPPVQLAQASTGGPTVVLPTAGAALAPAAGSATTRPAATQPASAAAATQPAPPATPKTTKELAESARQGLEMLDQGKPIDGRALLSHLLVSYARDLSADDSRAIREALTRVNQDLVFSNHVTAGDPLVEQYVVQYGDVLSRIVPKYQVPFMAVQLVNGLSGDRIRAEQRLKMIRGPFHIVVHKADFRLDLFLNDPTGQPIYIRSFTIGLGEGDSTPVGSWIVAGKTPKPSWTNPRADQPEGAGGSGPAADHAHPRKRWYGPDDPENPLGGFWIGLRGTDPQTMNLDGYGIHGTNEPQSVGKQMSMGCIRLLPDDISLLYKLLSTGHSTVRIEP